MFKPSTATFAVEEVLETEADGWVFESTAQGIHDSALKLLPLLGPTLPTDLSWPKITWTQTDELISLPGDISGRWDTSFNNQAVVTPQTFEFEPLSNFLEITTESGEYQILRQQSGGTVGKREWADNVSNADGWVVQIRTQVLEDYTGDFGPHGPYLLIDDGTHREQIYLSQTGLYFAHNPDLSIHSDLRSRPREIRIGARQDDIYVLLDDGLGLAGVNGFTGDSVSKTLEIGSVSDGPTYTSLWDYVNQYTERMIIDGEDLIERTYTTSEVFAYSPSYHPDTVVQSWISALVKTSGDLSGGTTNITVQYSSTATGGWVDFDTVTVDEIGWLEILLDNIPTEEDGSDQVRFKIGQRSTTGTAEPPRIETITVSVSFVDNALTILPNWGHRAGGNYVSLEQTPAARTIMRGRSPDTGLYLDLLPDATYGSVVSYASPIDLWGTEFYSWPLGDLVAGFIPGGTGELLSVFPTTLGIINSAEVTAVTGQGVMANDGGGIVFPDFTGSGLEFYLEIAAGAVQVAHNNTTARFYRDDYWTPRVVRLSLTGDADLSFTAIEDGSVWSFGQCGSYTTSRGYHALGTTPAESGSGSAASLYFTPYEYAQTGGAVLSTPAWELGLQADGLPYFRAGGVSVTGQRPLYIGTRHNLAWNYRDYLDHTAIQIFVDGGVVADEVTALTGIGGGILTGGNIAGVYEQVRTYTRALDARDFSRDNGFSEPVFKVDTTPPPDGQNSLILNFFESAGAVADDSGFDRHVLAPIDRRLNIRRDTRLYDEFATTFWGPKAQYLVTHSSDLEIPASYTVYAAGVFYTSSVVGQIYKKTNAAGTRGITINLLTTGVVQVTVQDAAGTAVATGTRVLGDGLLRYLAVVIEADGITIRVDDTDEEFPNTIGSLAAADQDAEIGPNLWCYFRTFVVRAGTLSRIDFDAWNSRSVAKWQPEDRVYIGGDLVDPDLVRHFSPWRKIVTMPPGEPGYASAWVETNGQVLPSSRPYKYTYGYAREIPEDRIVASVGSTKSPFRIMANVPDGDIGLAYLQGLDISVQRNVSYIDQSYLVGENVSRYAGGEFALTGLLASNGLLSSTGQIDTDALLIATEGIANRDFSAPTPGYYKYLVGRGRMYVYVPNATSTADIAIVKNAISLIGPDGKPVQHADFPWDIAISRESETYDLLPNNVFAVKIYTNRPYIPGATISVRYTAIDPYNDWAIIPGYTEILNTTRMLTRVKSLDGVEIGNYYTVVNPTGTYDIYLGNTGN